MKKLLTLILITLCSFSFAQNSKLQSLDIDLSNYEYPYPVSYITLNTQQQELKMAYMNIKPDNYNGKNILLLHGKNFNGAYWKTTINALTTAGYQVIVPDQIGFGKSAKPDHYQYTFQQLAVNTKAILDFLAENT